MGQVIILDTYWEQVRGVIGRYPNENEIYVLQYDNVKPRLIHMIGVNRPLHVTWVIDNSIVAEQILQPWTGMARHRADRVIERATS
jgi:hypothetical protein